MIKLKDMLNKDVTLGKVYTDKDKPPFQVKEEKLDEALKKVNQKSKSRVAKPAINPRFKR